ncbi:unnamed protein product, partial [marine sediment metagenome]
VGVKEETSDLMLAYNVTFDVCVDIGIIVAGRSQQRYNYLNHGWGERISFLAGVGSIWPKVDIFRRDTYENRIFKVFFKHGWHPSLRYALQRLNIIPIHNRQPWPELTAYANGEISEVVAEIKGMI